MVQQDQRRSGRYPIAARTTVAVAFRLRITKSHDKHREDMFLSYDSMWFILVETNFSVGIWDSIAVTFLECSHPSTRRWKFLLCSI